MTRATARLLVGRRIVGFELRTFSDGDGVLEATHHDPIILLDNGARVTFMVTETDSGDAYGIDPQYHPKKPRKRRS